MKIQIEECKEKACAVMIYMGTYIKDRKEGKYNDYVTYDGNPKADYKSYINLRTGEVCNISIDKCSDFEIKNFILDMPVKVYSFDSYLSNYTNLRSWFLEQLKVRKEEDIIEEIKQKYEKKINIEELRKTRENITNLEDELSKLRERKEKLQNKIQIIRDFCNHEVGVKTQDPYQKSYFSKTTCLICNKEYGGPFTPFKYTIHFENKKFSSLTEEEKVLLTYNMFVEERKKNSELSDSNIVEIINDKLKNNKEYITQKVLSNRPNLGN